MIRQVQSMAVDPQDHQKFMDLKREAVKREKRNVTTPEFFTEVLSVYLNYRVSNPYGKKIE